MNTIFIYEPPYTKRESVAPHLRRAFRLDNPVGDPFGGPAFGQYLNSSWDPWEATKREVSNAVSSVGDAFAKLDKEVFQPIGAALKPVGKMIEADPAAFIATIAAVALAPVTAGQSLWAIPVIQGVAAKSHGASWENTLKVTAISAATVYAGGQLAPQLSGGLQAAGLAEGAANAVASVVVAGSTAAAGAAIMGKNSDQILNAALTSGVAAAIPQALGAIPGFSDLAQGKVEGLNPIVSKGIASAIQGVAAGTIGAVINNKDPAQGAMMGIMSAGISTAVNGMTKLTQAATDLFSDPKVAEQLNTQPSGTQTLVANAVVQTLSAAATGGNVSAAFNQAMLGAASAAIGQTLAQNGGAINFLTNAVTGDWSKLDLTLKQYQSQTAEYEGIAEERNALADQAEEERARQEAILEQRANYVEQYEGLHDGIEDLKTQATQDYNSVKAQGEALNSKATSIKTASANQQTYINKANAQYNTVVSYANAANTALQNAQGVIDHLNTDDHSRYTDGAAAVAYHTSVYNNYIASYNNYKNLYAQAQATYDSYVSTANNYGNEAQTLLNQYNAQKSQYDAAIKEYEADSKNLAGLVSEANSLSNTITDLGKTAQQIADDFKVKYEEPIKVLDNQLGSLVSQIDKTITEYQKNSDNVEKNAQPLADLVGQLQTAVNKNITTAIDPNFNEAEYKEINGLTSTENAWQHYVTEGKDLGLYTNLEASAAARSQEMTRLMEGIADMTGRSLASYDPSEVADLEDKLYSKFGNNLTELKNATAESVISESGLAASDWLDPGGKKYTPASDWFYKTFGPTPAGTRQATQEEVAGNKATLQYVDGKPVWLVSDGSQSATQVKDGEILKNVVLETYHYVDENGVGRTIDKPIKVGDYIDRNTGEVVSGIEIGPDGTPNVIVRDPNQYYSVEEITDKNQVQAFQLDDLGGLETVYAYGGMDKNAQAIVVDLGGVSKQAIIDASKAVIDAAQSTGNSTLINTAANVVKAGGGFITAVGGIATVLGIAPKDSDLGKQLEELGKAGNTQEYRDKINAINTMVGNAKGVGGTLNAIWEGFKSAPMEFLAEYVGVEGFQEIAPLLIGGGAGTFAKGLALAKGMGEVAAKQIGSRVALQASMASDLVESIGGQATSAYETTYKLAIQKGMTEAAASNYALDVAAKSGLMAGVLTAGTFGIGGLALEKALLPSGASSGMFASAIEKMWDFAKTGTKITIKEGVSEAGEEGLSTLFLESQLYALDPKRDVAAAVTQAAAFGALAGGPIAGGTFAASNGADILNAAYTLGNEQFTKQLGSGNYTMGELGVVLNQWIPPEAVGLRSALVPPIISSNPQYAAAYSNAGDFLTALQSATGVSSPAVLSSVAETVADGKFAAQVTTAQEAVALLQSQGLTNVTVDDALKANIIGLISADQNTKAAQYIDTQMVNGEEVRAAAAQENYEVTQADLDKLVGRGVEANVIAKFIAEADPKATTTAEATQFFLNQGYDKATAADIAQFVKSAPEEAMKTAVAEWVNPRQVTRSEALQFFSQLGYTPTEAEITQFVVQGPEVFQDAVKNQLGEYVDPRFVDATEVREAFKNLGLTAPVSATDVLRLSGQYSEAELAAKAKEALPVVSANAMYALMAGDANATEAAKKELLAKIEEYKALNMSDAEAQRAATEAVAAQVGLTKDALLTAIGATENNLMVKITNVESTLSEKIDQYRNEGLTQADAQAKALAEMSTELGTTKQNLLDQIGATEENLYLKISDTRSALEKAIADAKASGLKGDAALQAAIDTVAGDLGTTKSDLLTKLGTTESALKTEFTLQLSDAKTALEAAIADAKDAGLKGDAALQAAIDTVAGDLGTTKADLLTQLNTTETALRSEFSTQLGTVQTQLQTDVAATKKAILDQVAAYESANIDRDTALNLAISGVAQDLGIAKTDLLTKIGTTEANLKTELATTKTELSGQIQDVATLLGKPASQVTPADLQMVQNMVGGTAATNLAYDTNKDGKIDQTDVTNIQNQLAFDQNTNIQQQLDTNTGLVVYIDTTTGKEVEPPSLGGSQWAPTGIYSALANQQAKATAAAKAAAQTAKTNQQKNQFSQMMQMVLGAPDVGGQGVTVSAQAGKPLDYIYDFSSIFATPKQAAMMPSPYGAINTYGQQPQPGVGGLGGIGGLYQQAANQPMYKQASGFAEGGMINNDISVGGGGDINDLLNILKGNG